MYVNQRGKSAWFIKIGKRSRPTGLDGHPSIPHLSKSHINFFTIAIDVLYTDSSEDSIDQFFLPSMSFSPKIRPINILLHKFLSNVLYLTYRGMFFNGKV